MVDLQQFADVQEFKMKTLFHVALLCAMDPDNMNDITKAAYSGVKAHADYSNTKHVAAHNAMVSALALMSTDRLTPGVKELLSQQILKVKEDSSAAMKKGHEKARKVVEG